MSGRNEWNELTVPSPRIPDLHSFQLSKFVNHLEQITGIPQSHRAHSPARAAALNLKTN